MFNTDFLTAPYLHEIRVGDAERPQADFEPGVTEADLMRELRQWMQTRAQQHETSEALDVHAN
jgi:hypothetical protein